MTMIRSLSMNVTSLAMLMLLSVSMLGMGLTWLRLRKVCERIAVAKCVHLFITLPDGPWNDLKNQTPAAYRKSLKERTKSMKLLTNADQLAECVRCHGGTKPLLGMISAMVGRGKTLCSLCKHMS